MDDVDDRVILSGRALKDLNQIRARFSHEGAGPKAKKALQHVLDALNDLPDQMDTWPDDKDDPSFKKRSVEDYRVKYAPHPKDHSKVYVLRIKHPGEP